MLSNHPPHHPHTANENVERVSKVIDALRDKIKLLEKEIQLHEAVNEAQKQTIQLLDEEIKRLKHTQVRTQHSGGMFDRPKPDAATFHNHSHPKK